MKKTGGTCRSSLPLKPICFDFRRMTEPALADGDKTVTDSYVNAALKENRSHCSSLP